ncbi:hypothetical protein GIB67_041087 [Kingdonia uniflora]|uniref:NAB domain-containing protein n=1 Tax=Kingdonia uniflora TaxID=39325 RepID=A0A7J7LKC9_9MAGN|nr:hypothetical protein GIB67_041087 [Kingdonia uniflora]
MSNPSMKRLESRKSHSWWWDSHISPKNNKWLADNLEEMDRSVKQMLKLIEEDGDSFAKKAEMYYRKRPMLISNVEEFYRMYRALAERYDHLTVELRKNIPSDLKSQSSGISDCGSESASPMPRPKKKSSRRRSSQRAAGFDFFLGSGGGSGESSFASSDSESGSVYSGPPPNGDGLQRKIVELEVELHDVKEKLRITEEENVDILSKVGDNCNHGELLDRIAWYEEELKVANERLRLSEEEISRLKLESSEELKSEKTRVSALQEKTIIFETNAGGLDEKIDTLEKKLSVTNKKLEASEEEIARLNVKLHNNETSITARNLQVCESDIGSKKLSDMETELLNHDIKVAALQEELGVRNEKLDTKEAPVIAINTVDLQSELEAAQKYIKTLESELEIEKQQVIVLKERILRFERDISVRDHEIRELKVSISDANNTSQLQMVTSESRAVYDAKLKEQRQSFGLLWSLLQVDSEVVN